MALKKIHETPVGTNCAVRIYRNYEYDEYVVKAIVKGKVQGGKDGGSFTSDKADAYGTAASVADWLRKRPACKSSLAARRRRKRR
jgi:hypothetical protein